MLLPKYLPLDEVANHFPAYTEKVLVGLYEDGAIQFYCKTDKTPVILPDDFDETSVNDWAESQDIIHLESNPLKAYKKNIVSENGDEITFDCYVVSGWVEDTRCEMYVSGYLAVDFQPGDYHGFACEFDAAGIQGLITSENARRKYTGIYIRTADIENIGGGSEKKNTEQEKPKKTSSASMKLEHAVMIAQAWANMPNGTVEAVLAEGQRLFGKYNFPSKSSVGRFMTELHQNPPKQK